MFKLSLPFALIQRSGRVMINGILREDDISVESLRRVFTDACYKTTLDDDGDLVITTDEGWRVVVTAEFKRKLIVYRAFFSFREWAQRVDMLDLINTLNDDVILARFAVSEPRTLTADYFIVYEGGLQSFQLVRSFRWFTRVVQQGIFEHDTKDLVS